MASCAKCGSVLSEGAVFCSVCGTPVSASGGTAAGTRAGMASNVAAALSYLVGFITGIIFLSMEPYKRDPYVRFHAFQSICFSVVIMIFWIIWSNVIVAGMFSFGGLWSILSLLSTLISLAIFVYWLFLMYKAYNNERYLIPVIGDFAAKQAAK